MSNSVLSRFLLLLLHMFCWWKGIQNEVSNFVFHPTSIVFYPLLTIQELLRNNPKSIHGECTNFPKNLILPSESVRPGNLEKHYEIWQICRSNVLSKTQLIANVLLQQVYVYEFISVWIKTQRIHTILYWNYNDLPNKRAPLLLMPKLHSFR